MNDNEWWYTVRWEILAFVVLCLAITASGMVAAWIAR